MQNTKGFNLFQFIPILIAFFSCINVNSQNQLFGPRNKVTTGKINNARNLFIDDINNDGKDDVICSAYDEIVGYENLGENKFDFQKAIRKSNSGNVGFSYTVSEDFNNDGNTDYAYLLGSELAWIENNGSGSFDSTHIISQGIYSSASDLETADFDNNGTPDLLYATHYGGLILRKNNGLGEFDLPDTIYTFGNGIWHFDVGDIDLDVDIDILVSFTSTADFSRQLFWLENNGNGVFPVKHFITDSYIETFYLGKMDNDDDLDILHCNRDYNPSLISWFENDGTGSFSLKNPIDSIDGYVHQLISTDINNDGKIDVLASAAYTYGLFWYENLGSDTFSNKNIVDPQNGFSHFVVGDLNSDEFADIVSASNSQVLWYRNEQNNSFSNENRLTSKTHGAYFITAADMNNDGLNDIISNGNEVMWFKNSGNKQLEEPEIILDQPLEGIFLVSDLDNDFDQDIVFDKNWYHPGFYWIANNGLGEFDSITSVNSKSETTDICAADFDTDGDIDLCTVSWSGYYYHENMGNGIFNYPVQINSPLGYYNRIFASDLDGDLDVDILMSIESSGRIYYYKNNGEGDFNDYVIIGYGDSPGSIYAADLNNDGNNEVIVVFSDKLVYYPSSGSGDFGEEIIISDKDNYYRALYVEDVDRDGFKDIIYYADGMCWHQNLGNGKFGKKRLIDDSHFISSIYTLDFDGDGDKDIFTAGNSSVSWYENLLITTSEDEINETSYLANIYPNPATNSFTIQSPAFEQENATVEIFDLYGRLVQKIEIPAGKSGANIQIGHLQKGMYIVRLNGSQNYSCKLVKN